MMIKYTVFKLFPFIYCTKLLIFKCNQSSSDSKGLFAVTLSYGTETSTDENYSNRYANIRFFYQQMFTSLLVFRHKREVPVDKYVNLSMKISLNTYVNTLWTHPIIAVLYTCVSYVRAVDLNV